MKKLLAEKENWISIQNNLDKHYKELKIQPLQIAKANFSWDEYMGYLKITAHKYLMRHTHKGKPIEDLQKCKFFIDLLINEYEDDANPPF